MKRKTIKRFNAKIRNKKIGINKEKIRRIKEEYGLSIISEEKLKTLPVARQLKYRRIERDIQTGKFIKKQNQNWIDNYKKILRQVGDKKVYELFEKKVNQGNARKLSHLLPLIQIYYVGDAYEKSIREQQMQEQTDEVKKVLTRLNTIDNVIKGKNLRRKIRKK